ncbi:hypothetical protein PG984_008401 [Apiospora sp. TS-2023a]
MDEPGSLGGGGSVPRQTTGYIKKLIVEETLVMKTSMSRICCLLRLSDEYSYFGIGNGDTCHFGDGLRAAITKATSQNPLSVPRDGSCTAICGGDAFNNNFGTSSNAS